MVDRAALRELHQQIRDALNEREASISEREALARHALAECDVERQEIERDRETLDAAEHVYARVAGVPIEPVSIAATEGVPPDNSRAESGDQADALPGLTVQRRARIGPQRYLILACLRERPHVPLFSIESSTGLSGKRVREQIIADEAVGVVSRTGAHGMTVFSLTQTGLGLLSRFESYRASRGLPLPTRDTVSSDGSDEDEEEEKEAGVEDA